MLNARRLEILQAVATHGSFSAATSALDYTHPAVTALSNALAPTARHLAAT